LNRYQSTLLGLIVMAMVVSWIHAPYPEQMYLQHIPTVMVVIAFPMLARRFPLTNAAVTCLAAFLFLHILGARYIYSYVPYDRWAQRLLGETITELCAFRRNHFDRLVHFAFGVLWVRPTWEVCVRYLRVPRRVAYYTALEFVLAFSMLYELVEWGLGMALAPQDADAYNGQQGDLWDAQKDMSAALVGAMVALVTLFLTRRSRIGVPPRIQSGRPPCAVEASIPQAPRMSAPPE
jgi:putative membrane protein